MPIIRYYTEKNINKIFKFLLNCVCAQTLDKVTTYIIGFNKTKNIQNYFNQKV